MAHVVLAASAGTIFEFYDFMLYGSLATVFGSLFFPSGSATASLLASLATFGAGFAVRPLGALVFGRLGDRTGRKRTFLITIVLMGCATALVGVLPTFATLGWGAPALLVGLRLVQGLALGGEFGGAALYIAEHAPAHRRGFYTSWIQTAGIIGFVLSLLVILATRAALGEEAFRAWGWRLPFLFSIVLVAVSLFVRLRLQESPLFAQLQASGGLSAAPITESLLQRANLLPILAALVVAAAMALTWYTAQFYSLVFMQTALQIDPGTAAALLVGALVLGVFAYVGAGALSDRIGRKPVMLTGMLCAALVVMPAYRGLLETGNPGLLDAQRRAPVTILAEPTRFAPFTAPARADAASRARDQLAHRGISYRNAAPPAPGGVWFSMGDAAPQPWDAATLDAALAAAGYPTRSGTAPITGPGSITGQHLRLAALIFAMIAAAALTCGPGAAWLSEIFPTRIRYTSLSVPYHLTSAWFGGFMPLTATWLVARSGSVLAGLWYPIAVCAVCFVLAALLMRETRGRSL
jgi:MFS family permease